MKIMKSLHNKIISKEEDYLFSDIEKFNKQHKNGSFQQSISLFRFYKSIEWHDPFYIVSVDDSNELKGILLGVIIQSNGLIGIKNYFSSRCIITGGPLVVEDDTDIVSGMLLTLDKFVKKKVIYSEFRNESNLDKFKNFFLKNSWKYEEHLNFIVDIRELNGGSSRISRSKKSQIKKSLRNGAKIEVAQNVKDIFEFYKILQKLYKSKVKKPLPSFDFFENLFKINSMIKYFLIKHEGKVIGGILCPIYNETISEWYICGQDGKYDGVYPSVLATWAPIDYALKNDLSYFDFMGAGKPGEDYGVREFKSKFGGNLVEHGRYVKVHKPIVFKISKLGLSILQRFN